MVGNEATAVSTEQFVPALFRPELKAGQWMYSSKLSIAVFLRPGYPLDVRIQAALMLHSWGFSSEVAVWQKKGKFAGDPPIKVPLSPFAIVKILEQATIQHYEESAPAGTPKPDTRIARTYMRQALAKMDDNGVIDRCRTNCQVEKLVGLSYREALAKGHITLVRDLSPTARKKLGRQMVIYLLAKPRKAKSYDAGLVSKDRYLGSQPVEITEQKRAVQLIFNFFPDLKTDPAEAAALAALPEAQRIFATYERECSDAQEHARERAYKALKRLRKPAEAEPGRPTSEEQAELFPADFHAHLCERFRQAGKPLPTRKQSGAIATKLAGREADFLRTLTTEKLRRVQHPGVLPSLTDEFLGAPPPKPAPAPEPPAPVCKRCENFGLIGVKWELIPEAVAAVERGAKYCDCNEGGLVHDLIEPERMRRAARVGRAS